MADDINQTTTEELAVQNKETASQQRIRELSDKVELTSKERDEKDRLYKEQTEKLETLEKENAFNSGFADILGTHPLAKDHKDEIKAKVLAGYSPEDAAYAVLGKAGKLGGAAPVQNASQVAGGSAATAPQSGQKEIKDMTRAEMRAQLEKELVNQ